GTTIPVSVPSAGATPVQAAQPVVSASGRYVAFTTVESLTAIDTNGLADIYVFDRIAGTTTLASVTSTGGVGNGASTSPDISGTGQYVVFSSTSSNMAAGDANPASDIFVRDFTAGTTTRVSDVPPVANFEARDPSISDDGAYVAFLFLTTTVTQEGTAPARVYTALSNGSGAPRGSLSATTEGAVLGDDSAYDPTLSLF